MSRSRSAELSDLDDLYSDSEGEEDINHSTNQSVTPSKNQTAAQVINQSFKQAGNSIKQAGTSINQGIKNVISTTNQSINKLGASIQSLDLKALINPDTWQSMYLSTASRRARFAARCYQSSIFITVFIQLFVIVMFLLIDPNVLRLSNDLHGAMSTILILSELTQLFVIGFAHVGMFHELQALYVRPTKIWNIYVSTVITFAAVYFSVFCFNRASFNVDGYSPDARPDGEESGSDEQTYNDVPTVFCFFLYFSGAIITSTGFGDISPSFWYSQFLTNLQMLVGVAYHVGVFGLTLSHFRSFQRIAAEVEEQSALTTMMNLVEGLDLARRMRDLHPWIDIARKACLRNLALFSIVCEILITLLLFAIPGDPFESLTVLTGERYRIKLAMILVMIVAQTGLFITIMFVSFRLVKAINNRDLSTNFLVQSYIATALLFGGIYFILFVATPHHQFSRSADFDQGIFEVLYIFIHFSLTVMSTTGFGDVYARGVAARLFVLVQMLVSILYNAVIIGLGTSQLIDMQSAKAEQQFDELRRQVSRDASLLEGEDAEEIEMMEQSIEESISQSISQSDDVEIDIGSDSHENLSQLSPRNKDESQHISDQSIKSKITPLIKPAIKPSITHPASQPIKQSNNQSTNADDDYESSDEALEAVMLDAEDESDDDGAGYAMSTADGRRFARLEQEPDDGDPDLGI